MSHIDYSNRLWDEYNHVIGILNIKSMCLIGKIPVFFLWHGLTCLDGVLIWWILAKKKKFLGPFNWFVNFWIMENRISTSLFFCINQENAIDPDLKTWCCNPSNLKNWLWILAAYLYFLYEWGGEAIYLLWSLWKWSSGHIRDKIGNYIFDNGRVVNEVEICIFACNRWNCI